MIRHCTPLAADAAFDRIGADGVWWAVLQPADASSRRLIQLCGGYFATYLITGVLVKYFQGKADAGFPGMSEAQFLVYSTTGGTVLCLAIVLWMGWWRLPKGVNHGRLLLAMIPAGMCTAVVIPSTTLLYSLPITLMVAMVIMRGSIIVVSRAVDAIQIRQGMVTRVVFWEENVAVGFSLCAVALHLFFTTGGIVFTAAAAAILAAYVGSYAIRIYLMNWFKNTQAAGTLDNRIWFGVEQLVASTVIALVMALILGVRPENKVLIDIADAVYSPHPRWFAAIGAGSVYGIVAFFSVFIFMFKGRTATFAGLANRLTSLVAGTGATLVSAWCFGTSWPKVQDWQSLALIFVAVVFLSRAERRRASG